MSDEPGTSLIKAVEDAAPAVQSILEATGTLDILRQETGTFADRLYLRREKRWAVGVMEAAADLKAKGVDAVAIRDKTLRAVYEHMTVEEDRDLTRLWINLLEAALAGAEVPPVYPDILRQLEPIEARFLDALHNARALYLPQPGLSFEQLKDHIAALLPELRWRHLDNLERLQLLVYTFDGPVNIERPSTPADAMWDVRAALTSLGEDFIAFLAPSVG